MVLPGAWRRFHACSASRRWTHGPRGARRSSIGWARTCTAPSSTISIWPGSSKYGDAWQYADINTALLGLAEILQPAAYLEIGVRRGRSLAMVLSRAPSCHIVACDMFIENYSNMENPGPDFVRSELDRLGCSGTLDFVVGDSSKVLPQYFKQHPEVFFDLITVDGDHTAHGARTDLTNVIPRLKIGGALVFDDVSNPSHPELRQVWRDTVVARPGFSTFTFDEIGFGVGVGIRHA